MNIENLLQLKNVSPGDDRHETIRREKTAEEFEELFARHLVREMTKIRSKWPITMVGPDRQTACTVNL